MHVYGIRDVTHLQCDRESNDHLEPLVAEQIVCENAIAVEL